MAKILYAEKMTNKHPEGFTRQQLKSAFAGAGEINRLLEQNRKKIAYFFLDPLLNYFEAGHKFYFEILGCTSMDSLNCYRSGAGPVQALSDAHTLIEQKLCDAVFIFGCEQLLAAKKAYGGQAIAQAMDIFQGPSLPECYHNLAVQLCRQLALSPQQFTQLADQLYANYLKTYASLVGAQSATAKRGRYLHDLGAPLFRLTDCANPNLNFAGGLILGNDECWQLYNAKNHSPVRLLAAHYRILPAQPDAPKQIVGSKANIFPHLQVAIQKVAAKSQVNIKKEFFSGNLLLDVYTCYPPIPLGFLLAAGLAENVEQLPELLAQHAITVTGGMSLAGAPWNNPALNSSIQLCHQLAQGQAKFALVHGNGGMGETQGIALFGT